MIKVGYNQWLSKYQQQVNDIYQIFLNGVNYEEKYYSDDFYHLFTKTLFKKSSGFISKWI